MGWDVSSQKDRGWDVSSQRVLVSKAWEVWRRDVSTPPKSLRVWIGAGTSRPDAFHRVSILLLNIRDLVEQVPTNLVKQVPTDLVEQVPAQSLVPRVPQTW